MRMVIWMMRMVIWMMRMMDGEDGDDLTVEPVPVQGDIV